MTQTHPFDAALVLAPAGADRYTGHTSPAYQNMVGPFGGATAATALNAVLQHPALLGEPVSLTVNFAAALAEGNFNVLARAVRTNRSTQHWLLEFTQSGKDGAEETVLTATVLTAARRETWGSSDVPMPSVAPVSEIKRLQGAIVPVEWLRRYDMHPIGDWTPRAWDGALNAGPPEDASTSRLWLRDDPPRPLDFCSLAAFADVFYPRVWRRRARAVPAGTVSLTVYFHASSAMLRECGTDYIFGQAKGQAFYNGFFDQNAHLWNASGTLLATSTQIVYYKE